jgi:hypothetical protein
MKHLETQFFFYLNQHNLIFLLIQITWFWWK